MISSKNLKGDLTAKRTISRKNFASLHVVSRLNLFQFSALLCLILAAGNSLAQTKKPSPQTQPAKSETNANLPKVTQIDAPGLKNLLKPDGKPLLINFWATWCEPCREEFPDLVKINQDYKDRIDVLTVSLDDLAEIKTGVPKFLAAMEAKMPAYLLKTPDEGAAMALVSKDWQGALPFTVLYNAKGEMTYSKQGKFKTDFLRAEIEKSLVRKISASDEIFTVADFVKIKNGRRDEAIYYYENNWKVYREAALKRGVIHSYELIETKADGGADFDLILITRYAGEAQLQASEKNFEPILKEIRPDGARLKNEFKPEDFRQNVFVKIGKIIVSPAR